MEYRGGAIERMEGEKTTVFVTGATGMVGSYVVSELLRTGKYAISFSFRNELALEKLHQRLRFDGLDDQFGRMKGYKVDLEFKQELIVPFSTVDVVVNCAAQVNLGNKNKNRLIRDNIEIATAVIAAAQEAGVKRLIHLSSIATLGQNPHAVTEESLLTSLSDQNAYSIAKFYAEAEVWKAIHNGMNAIILNPAVVLGSGDWNCGSPSIFKRIAQGILCYPCGKTGYIGAEDVARAVERVIGSTVSSERFVLCSDNLTYKELMHTCAESLGVTPPKYQLGRGFLRATAAILDGAATLYLRGNFSGSLLRTLSESTNYDGSKFTKQFNFAYSPINEQIDKCAKEYKNR